MNISRSNALFKNIFSLTFGRISSLIINVFALVLVARHLGADKFGVFSSLLSTIIIFSKIVDLGFVPVVFKEFSRNIPNKSLFSTAFTIRVIAFFIVGFVFNIWFYYAGKEINLIILANLLFFNVVISAKYVNFRELLEIPFKAELKAGIPMLTAVLDSLLLFLAVLYMVYYDKGLNFFVYAYAICNIPGFIITVYFLVKKYKISFKPNLNSGKTLLLASLPIWGYALLNSVFQQLDIILLERMETSTAAGIYSVAPRLLTPILIIPSIIVSGFYPILVKYFEDKNDSFELLKQNVFKILFFVPFVAASIITFKADYIIDLVFGVEFIEADFSTIILFWTQVFLFYSFFVKNLLVIYNTQNWNFYEAVIVLLINIVLNLLLIPLYKQDGAALAKICAALFSFMVSLFALYKSHDKLYIFNVNILFWGGLLILFQYLISGANIILYLLLNVLFVPLLTFGLNFFTREELYFIFKAVNRPILWDKISSNKIFTFFYRNN